MTDWGVEDVGACLLTDVVCALLAFLFLAVSSDGVALRVVHSWLILECVFLGSIPCCQCFDCSCCGSVHVFCGDPGVVNLVACLVGFDSVQAVALDE